MEYDREPDYGAKADLAELLKLLDGQLFELGGYLEGLRTLLGGILDRLGD